MTISHKASEKSRNSKTLLTSAALLLIASMLGSCRALSRGDVMQQTDDTLFFSKIGFLAGDNLPSGLPRDTVVNVQGHGDVIVINVPYVTDTTLDLNVYFETVGKGTTVEYEDAFGVFNTIESSSNSISFHDGGTNPRDVRFRISKTDTFSDDSNVESQEIKIRVVKTITPVLVGGPAPGDISPLYPRISFVDEEGTTLTTMPTPPSLIDNTLYHWDDWQFNIVNGPTYTAVGPLEAGFEIEIVPFYPGEHKLFVDSGFFTDPNGYTNSAGELRFIYDPPAVHLSQNGNDGNNGLSPETAVKTWTRARNIAQANSLFDMYIEASPTPYDVPTVDGVIDGLGTRLSIYGSFMPGFTAQYEGDWKTRASTILTNLTQAAGAGPGSPSFVLKYESAVINSEYVLDNVQIVVSRDNTMETALWVNNGASPRISESTFYSTSGSSAVASAVTITNFASPQIRDSRFIGRKTGGGQSYGIFAENNAQINVWGGLIYSGNLSGAGFGVQASNNSQINMAWTSVLAGVPVENDTNILESENRGIFVNDSSINLNAVWVHSDDASSNSTALRSVDTSGGHTTNLAQSSFVSGTADMARGLFLFDSSGSSNLRLFNSVVLGGKSNLVASMGLQIDNLNMAQIMGNAIHVREGSTVDDSIGIDVSGSGSLDVRNNLIWSDNTNQFQGINSSSGNFNLETFHHNNFWDTDGAADFDFDNTGRKTLTVVQNSNAGTYGNVAIPVSVDKGFSYSTNDLSIGRISGTPPVDVMYGGEDLSSIPEYPYDTNVNDKRDRSWNPRNGNNGVGWSMGPYEYGNAAYLPSIIYVAMPTNGGSDGHPLGTRQAPLESPARAYDLARTNALARWDVTDIRVAQGVYDLQVPNIMPAIQHDIRILGGYQPGSWIRNPSVYTTELTRLASAVLVYTSNSVSRASLLDGFTLRNTAVGGGTVGLSVQTAAAPEIDNNIIIGGSSNDSRGLEVISSWPRIENNTILAGTAVANATGVYLQDSSGTELRNNNIDAGVGNFTRGLHVFNTGAQIEGNSIFGGIAGDTSYGAYFDGAVNSMVDNNTIRGGAGTTTYGVNISNPGPLLLNRNRIFGSSANLKNETNGILIDSAPETVLTNNIIHAGNEVTANSRGIRIQNGADKVYLYNNTVFGGRSDGISSTVLNTDGNATPHVINNILIAGTGIPAAQTRVVWQSNANKPTRFLNNILLSIDPAAIPYTEPVNSWMDENEIELYLNGGIPNPNYQDNRVSIAENPSAYFVNFIPGLDEAAFLGENWRLSGGGAVDARNTGVNLNSDPWHSFNTDGDGKTRTAPWSVGAYEY